MRALPISLLVLLLSCFLDAQSVLNPVWVKEEESGFSKAEGWGVAVDDEGNVYWSPNTNALNQGLDIKCYKYDPAGNEVWNAPLLYGGPGTQQAYVLNAASIAVYIGGRSCTGLVNTCDMLLLRIDKDSGELIWDETLNFSAGGYEEVDGLELLPDGIYCGGWAQELQSGLYQTDIGLWKLDYSGNTVWTNHLGQPNSAEHQDGHFVVDDTHIFAAGLWNGTGFGNLYNGHSFLGKFSKEDGSLVDSVLFGPQSDQLLDIENALGMTTDGEFLYITGYSTPLTPDDWQIFVAKYDKDLQQIWYTDWGGAGTESARGIAVANNMIYVAGLTESEELLSGGTRDALLLKMDLDGNPIEYLSWGDTLINSFRDLAITDHRIYLSGTSLLDPMGNAEQAFLVAFDDMVSSAHDHTPRPNLSFSVFPNPAAGQITIKLAPDQPEGVLRIIDISGKVLLQQQIQTGQHTLELEREGVFLIQLDYGAYTVSRKVVNRG